MIKEKKPKLRIIFEVPPDEYNWVSELADSPQANEAGVVNKIDLFRMLLDAYADQIKFKPRPQ